MHNIMALNPFLLTCLFCGILFEVYELLNKKQNDIITLCYIIGSIALLFNEYYFWVGCIILLLGVISMEFKENTKYYPIYKVVDSISCCMLLVYVIANSFFTSFRQI